MPTEAAEVLKEHCDSGLRVRWPLAWPNSEYAYDLEIHVSPQDYMYHISESVAPFDSTNCPHCGHRLDYDPRNDIFLERRIYATCPRCGTFFDPSKLPATYTHGWTGEKSILLGGTTYRFALILDNVPREEWEHFQIDPAFVELSKRIFGWDFYGVVDVG